MAASRITRNILLGVENLLLHKLRTFLTMLGVVFGVGSVVAMLSVGEGASQEALEQIRKIGSNNILVNSVQAVQDASASAMRSNMSIYGLTYEDQLRIEETFKNIRQTVPVKLARKECRLGERALELRVVGTLPAWFQLLQRQIVAGRVLTDADVRNLAGVVVLTEYGARRLLAAENTIGQTLRLGGSYFEIIGIVKSEGGTAGNIQMPDEQIDAYIPITVARERFGDISTTRTAGGFNREMVELHQLIVEVASIEDVESVANGIEAMLRRFHKKEDYRVSVPLALLRQAEATKRTFNIVLGSIAAISLLVGGIGIMNIMLASVTERTREIGIRRAIGAKRRQIISQFLIETIVLSTAGGLVGIGLGMLIPWLITVFAGMPTIVTIKSVVLSVGISIAVGVIFGLYPAIRAAKVDPIVALRHE
ncbi:MAG TPA: ABC transporter permease [Anaerohalosphaeraceae bacterium]|jgi:putative ABC transport system permease protein|nr:ABC transporter permease [Anaerohalosphaeraceae bacterium]HRT49668.1 ABC transporter permease [Anaerohalosphaeraceae bacterium]HRT85985.1 ABC transporter permease [Anaerohalosphaeraceae bacterium]